jgi:hypothetical protein
MTNDIGNYSDSEFNLTIYIIMGNLLSECGAPICVDAKRSSIQSEHQKQV